MITTVKDESIEIEKVYSTVMNELLVHQLTNDTLLKKKKIQKDLKEILRNEMHEWPIWPCVQNNFQSECKVGLGLKGPKNYKLQSL